jgi:hypothetical protein
MTAGTGRLLAMRRLREQGWSLADIGWRYGITAARVSQLLGPDGRRFRVSVPEPLTQQPPAA